MSRKKRILFITEASYLNTGYASYSREVMSRLFKTNKYELAELSTYGEIHHPRRSEIPWKNYPNMPDPKNTEHVKQYNAHPANQFGAWRFERVCLDFEPDIVFTIRDFWMDSFIYHSPFRNIFSWAWMPTCDASPQNPEWIDIFGETDYLITYSDWAGKIIQEQAGNQINYLGSAPPLAPPSFQQLDKKQVRNELGIPEDWNVIGTVMRNQRRKLFPSLFNAFSQFLKATGDTKTYLYCHTSYPDAGWNIAQLLLENEISSRVIFTYVCENCKHIEVCKMNDAKKVCPNCKQYKSSPSSVSNGLSDSELAKVYNSFDLYLQVANSEGFGIPAIEAASCGVPLAVVNYSAMEDFVNKVGAFPIRVAEKYKELETGCDRAVPDTQSIVDIMSHFFSLPEKERNEIGLKCNEMYKKNYNWDTTVEKWINAADSCSYANWKTPPLVKPLVEIPLDQPTNKLFVQDCLNAYNYNQRTGNSHYIRSMRRDLNRGITKQLVDGFYVSEFSPLAQPKPQPFNREFMVKIMKQRLENYNIWEQVRSNRSLLIDWKESWLN